VGAFRRSMKRLTFAYDKACKVWTLEGVFGKRAQWAFANIRSDAQTQSEPKSITSAVQNSGAEWRTDR
jgi:hypothetical protein